MKNKIVNLINKVQRTYGNGSFEVLESQTNFHQFYDLGDLTKNYVEFVSDIILEKFGEVDENIIKIFGTNIQTDPSNFSPSTSSKPSTIKQVSDDGIFISTNLTKTMMESLIIGLSKEMKIKIKFNSPEEVGWNLDKVIEVYSKYKNKSDLIKNEPEVFRIATRNQWHDKAASHFGTLKIFLSEETRDRVSSLMSTKKTPTKKRDEIFSTIPKYSPINNKMEDALISLILEREGIDFERDKSIDCLYFDFYCDTIKVCIDIKYGEDVPSDLEFKQNYCNENNLSYIVVERMKKSGLSVNQFETFMRKKLNQFLIRVD